MLFQITNATRIVIQKELGNFTGKQIFEIDL